MIFRLALLATTAVAMTDYAAAETLFGTYVSLKGGVGFLQPEILKPKDVFGPLKTEYSFNPGAAFAGSMGFGLGNGLRLELEGDYAANKVSGAKLSNYASSLQSGGHQTQWGAFVNAFYDADFGLPVKPYVGLGIGVEQIQQNLTSGPFGYVFSTDSKDSGASFAYQAVVGVSYPLPWVPGLSVTAEYRLLGALSHSANATSYTGGVIVNGTLLGFKSTLGDVINHQGLIGLRYEFGADIPQPSSPALVPSAAFIPPPPPAAPVQRPPAQDRPTLVFFDGTDADLTERGRQAVAIAARNVTPQSLVRVEVDGLTDRTGTAETNRKLTARRVETVVDALTSQGVPRPSISVLHYGDSKASEPGAAGVEVLYH